MSERLATDEIILRVPASMTHAPVVRAGSAALARRRGLSSAEADAFDESVEAKIAALMGSEADASTGSTVTFTFRVGNGRLEVHATAG